MHQRNYIFVRTPLSLYASFKCLLSNKLSIADTLSIVPCSLIDYFNDDFIGCKSDKITYDKVSSFFIFSLILKSYTNKINVLILNDLGLYNKLLIVLLKCSNIYIIDDGLASLNRSSKVSKILLKISTIVSKFIGKKEISYFSLYPPSFEGQNGKFEKNLDGIINAKKKLFYKDILFYIDSAPCLDGMSEQLNIDITNFIKNYAVQRKKDLIILPHRRNSSALKDDYVFKNYLPQNYFSFESFYFTSTFYNCVFVTLYSGAICMVDHRYERYYVKSNFEPQLEKTAFEKITFKKNLGVTRVYNLFKKTNVKEITYK